MPPVPGNTPDGYLVFLTGIKERIRTAQVRAALSVNRELVLLYWQIGKDILERQEVGEWGAKVIDHISRDLIHEFPGVKGFSTRNLNYMRKFAEVWPNEQFVQQVAAQIPWSHNCTILDKVRDPDEQEWYIRKTIENGWSRNVLVHQIETRLFEREGKAVTNFSVSLPPVRSDLATQLLKDPYMFDFLDLGEDAVERDLERGLLENLRNFLIELGVGFSFVGSQYHLDVGEQDYYLDLLFYHLRLRCFVVIDLKIGDFLPEYAGKMNFYLSAVDDLLRHPDDLSSIGIILCKSRNRVIAEYALRDMKKPMGVSTYQLMTALPDNLKESLPSVEVLEAELERGSGDRK